MFFCQPNKNNLQITAEIEENWYHVSSVDQARPITSNHVQKTKIILISSLSCKIFFEDASYGYEGKINLNIAII